MSYWTIVCRPRGADAWRPWSDATVWEATRDAVCHRIHQVLSARRTVTRCGGSLAELEFAPAQVRVEAE